MAISALDFKTALKHWASGVTVVTAKSAEHGLQGMTATSFSSLSLDPPQILVCLNQEADTTKGVFAEQKFAVNVLTSEQQVTSNEFAGACSQAERFANVAWSEGEFGMPIFDSALVSLECRLVQKFLAGTHWVVIGEIEKVHCRTDEPLLYYNSAYQNLAKK